MSYKELCNKYGVTAKVLKKELESKGFSTKARRTYFPKDIVLIYDLLGNPESPVKTEEKQLYDNTFKK